MLYFLFGTSTIYVAFNMLVKQHWFRNFLENYKLTYANKIKNVVNAQKGILANIAYYSIYSYSAFQMFFIKKYTKIVQKFPIIKTWITNIQVFLDKLNNVNRVIKVRLHDTDPSSYDFLIYQNKRDEKLNHIIHFHEKKHEENENTLYMDPSFLTYDYCHFKFIYICMFFDENEKYDIVLTQPYNYYIVNNVLNASVLLYLLKTQYNVIKNKNSKYTLEFFDHEMNTNTLSNDQEIVFELNGYKIRKSKYV